MTVIAVTSVKHSPGATTLALALVAARSSSPASGDRRAVLVEADPAGGDLAGRIGLPLEPGLASLAASARHAGVQFDIDRHVQALPCGGGVVVGPTSPELADGALRSLADRLPGAVRSSGLGVIDCGRWAPGSPAGAVLAGSDWTLVVVRPDLVGIDHLLSRIEGLRRLAGGALSVAVVGDRPYGAPVVAETTGCTAVAVALDPDGVEALHGGRREAIAVRSRLVRSARSILDAIATAPDPVAA